MLICDGRDHICLKYFKKRYELKKPVIIVACRLREIYINDNKRIYGTNNMEEKKK